MVADRDAGHPGPDLADDPRAFVAEHAREQSLRVEPVERIGVGVADAGRHDLDQHLAGARAVEVELDDRERLLGGEGDAGAGLHKSVPDTAPSRDDARVASLRSMRNGSSVNP